MQRECLAEQERQHENVVAMQQRTIEELSKKNDTLSDEIKRECATLFELKKSSSLDLSTAVLPSSLATTTAPPSPPPRSRFSNAGIAKLSPPSPSSSEKRRGSAMNSVMGELKGRLAIRRSQVVGKATPTAHLFI